MIQGEVDGLRAEFESRPAPEPEPGFVRSISRRSGSGGRIELLTVEFEPALFDPALFEHFGIEQPDSIRRAVPKRKAEFLAGRLAARWCMQQSGFAPEPAPAIPIGQHRAPVWPKGVTGSISHTTNRAICALCPAWTAAGLGIDLEDLLSPSRADSVAAQIHDDRELQLAVQSGIAANAATTLIFSAKESLFKALYPRVREYFGFEQARLREISAVDGRLVLSLRDPFHRRHGLAANHACRFALDARGALTLVIGPPAG
ncbi:MAG: 4'-phosphopantetheinyl transferase family protein [Wenzhouxiangellaceae bacterium]